MKTQTIKPMSSNRVNSSVLKWAIIWIVVNVFMCALTYASHKQVEKTIVKSFFEQIHAVLDTRKRALGVSFRIPSDHRNPALDSVMGHAEKVLGDTGETYLVKESQNGDCQIASKSRFPSYNEGKGVFTCTDHWSAVLGGSNTEGQWIDYREVAVFGVGTRIIRDSDEGLRPLAIIVERDVDDVLSDVYGHSKTLGFMSAGLAFVSLLYCLWGFVSERNARQSASDQEQLLSQLKVTMDSQPSGVMRVDKDQIIQYVNPALEKMFGYDEGELVCEHLHVIVPEQYRDAHDKGFARFYATGESEIMGEVTRGSLAGLKKDGTEFPCSLLLNETIIDGKKQIQSSFTDVTAEVEARERIERKNNGLRQFARVARHDLQNAVSPAAMAIEYQMEAGYDQEAMEMANRELQGAMQMFQDLGAWSKTLESDNEQLETEEIELNAILDTALLDGVKIEVGELGSLVCNEGMMTACVKNILINSVNYCNTQPDIKVWRDDSALRIKDNSGGIGCIDGEYSDEYARRLAEPGQRGRPDVEGSGLGLANCKALLQAQGFNFSWEVECGVGTTWNCEFS